MTRRTWRDLEKRDTEPVKNLSISGLPAEQAGGTAGLEEAARLAPDSQLNHLLARRTELENKIKGLTGDTQQDPTISQRFPVATFAERRQQEQAWAARRAEARRRQQPNPGHNGETARPLRQRRNLPASPLEGRMDAGMPGRSGLLDGPENRFAAVNRRARSGLRTIGDGLSPLQSVSEPVRNARQSIDGARDQLRDLDSQLASEDVSEADRAEIRKTLQGDRLDKTSAVLNRATAALDAPKRAVDRVDANWQAREQQITGAMDRFSGYANRREQRLSLDQGGSGDLFARMQANRQRALQRRREQQQTEQRDQQRRERALANRRERAQADA